MVKTNPTDYSGINNSGEWTITKHLIPKYVSNWSAVVEGYNLSSIEKYIDPVVYDNKLKPGKNAILDRADFYTMHNWDKTKFNQFNTESQTYLPMNLVHASSLSQVNAEILDNTEKVDVVGTSSTIRIHFSRRPGGIQQIEYLIPSVNTSAFTLGRAGGDTGMALNLNQRFWEFDYIRPECSSAETAKFFGAPSSTGQQSNPTRGGSRYNPSGSGLWGENGWYVADQGWPPSPTTYRNYVTGVVPNTNIVSAAFKSCVIPFDFVSNKGEVESTSNQYKGVDEQYQYYALWKNQRWYEDITVNYEGIEGATHHVNWMYFPKVKDNVPYGKTLFDDNLGPALNNYFDKAYMYFPISGRNYELVDLDDKGLSGGIDYNYLLTHGWPELTGTDTSWSHYLSGTVSGFYKNTTFTYINENTYNPIVAKYPAGTFQSLLTNTLTESDWNSFIDRIRPDLNNSRIDNITVESVRPRTYFRPLDSLFDYDRTNNYYYNQWGDKGTLFFDWPKFKTALNYYYQGKTQNRQDLITSAQSIADDCYYFCMILEKTAGNFATTGIEAGKPFITSGPYAVGILAKGDTDLNHYHIFNSTGVIYSGNHCSGDFNQFTFIQQRYQLGFLYDRGWLTASSNGSPEIWYGLQGNLFNMHAYSYTGKAKGWVGNQYWLVYGKNALEVKSKIDRIIASGGPKRRPSISNIPKVILDNAPPLQ